MLYYKGSPEGLSLMLGVMDLAKSVTIEFEGSLALASLGEYALLFEKRDLGWAPCCGTQSPEWEEIPGRIRMVLYAAVSRC